MFITEGRGARPAFTPLLARYHMKLRVLYLRSEEYGDAGVGILPEHKEVPIRGSCFRRVARQRIGAAQLKMRERRCWLIQGNARMIDQLFV